MNLPDTLTLIAQQLNLDPTDLIAAAKEDYQTGWDNGNGAFPIGSLFGVEGQTLYALIRVLKSENIYELGTHYGASTTHLALAVHANGVGRVTSVDMMTNVDGTSNPVGGMVPPDLRAYVDFVHDDAIARLATCAVESVDFIFEDLMHHAADCEQVGKLAQVVLKPGGVLVAHDAAHRIVGKAVRDGYFEAMGDFGLYLTEPSDCGLLIWKKPLAPEAKKRTRQAKG